jgi:hypothetical protein
VKNTPDKEEMENFWREIYGKKVSHYEEVCWIKGQCQQNPSIEWSPICEKDVAKNNAKLESPWKRPDTKFLA